VSQESCEVQWQVGLIPAGKSEPAYTRRKMKCEIFWWDAQAHRSAYRSQSTVDVKRSEALRRVGHQLDRLSHALWFIWHQQRTVI